MAYPGNKNTHAILPLDSDNECSTRSMLSSLDYSHEKTDDDLELSIIRSVRDVRDVHTLAVPGASDRRHSLRKQSVRFVVSTVSGVHCS